MEDKRQLVLPFAEREYVSMNRTCAILGASWQVVNRMAHAGLLILVDFRNRGKKRVHYQSIVEHCNRLRQEYAIPDRRPVLACELFRHRDEDILPFPLRDTIGTERAAALLGYDCIEAVQKSCEEGQFESYRLHPSAPWRISLPSLAAFLEEITKGVHLRQASPQREGNTASPVPVIGTSSEKFANSQFCSNR